jgi:hypothetical protein
MKIASEQEFRKKILQTAKRFGCDIEIKQIFARYDNLLKYSKNETERKQIALLGVTEIHKFLGCRGALVVNGELIIPAEENLVIKDDF